MMCSFRHALGRWKGLQLHVGRRGGVARTATANDDRNLDRAIHVVNSNAVADQKECAIEQGKPFCRVDATDFAPGSPHQRPPRSVSPECDLVLVAVYACGLFSATN